VPSGWRFRNGGGRRGGGDGRRANQGDLAAGNSASKGVLEDKHGADERQETAGESESAQPDAEGRMRGAGSIRGLSGERLGGGGRNVEHFAARRAGGEMGEDVSALAREERVLGEGGEQVRVRMGAGVLAESQLLAQRVGSPFHVAGPSF